MWKRMETEVSTIDKNYGTLVFPRCLQTVVLEGLLPAWLRRSNGIRYFLVDVAVADKPIENSEYKGLPPAPDAGIHLHTQDKPLLRS